MATKTVKTTKAAVKKTATRPALSGGRKLAGKLAAGVVRNHCETLLRLRD